MAKLQYRTISKRTVDGLSVDDRDAVFWDRELPGFGNSESSRSPVSFANSSAQEVENSHPPCTERRWGVVVTQIVNSGLRAEP